MFDPKRSTGAHDWAPLGDIARRAPRMARLQPITTGDSMQLKSHPPDLAHIHPD